MFDPASLPDVAANKRKQREEGQRVQGLVRDLYGVALADLEVAITQHVCPECTDTFIHLRCGGEGRSFTFPLEPAALTSEVLRSKLPPADEIRRWRHEKGLSAGDLASQRRSEPANSSTQPSSSNPTSALRFTVGTRVEVRDPRTKREADFWSEGIIVALNKRAPKAHPMLPASPYEVHMDSGATVFVSRDLDSLVRPAPEECLWSPGDARLPCTCTAHRSMVPP